MTQSQKSCTCPSLDTEEDQGSRMSSRKKESRFRRFKKRLVDYLRRDRRNKFKKGYSPKTCSVKAHTVNPCHSETETAYNTLDDGIVEIGHDIQSDDRTRVNTDTPEMKVSSGRQNGDSGANSDTNPGLLKIFRNSLRRLKKDKTSQSDKKFKMQKNEKRPQENPSAQSKTPQPERTHPFIDNSTREADDITHLFEKIIDWMPTRTPVRTKLRLDGLVKCKRDSFDRPSPAGMEWPGVSSDLTTDVETDGGWGQDVTDEPTLPTEELQEDESDGENAYQNDNQRVCHDITYTLQAIGYSIAFKRSTESESEAGSFRARRRPSSLELDIIKELRNVADTHPVFQSDRAKPNVELLPLIASAIKSLLKAPTYDEFKQAASRELADTVGWEQVAWYTYLVQASMLVVKGGVWAGQSFKDNATRYFRSTVRPFIRSRPNGWKSIYEETDVDTELD